MEERKRKPRGPYGLHTVNKNTPVPRSTRYSQAKKRRISSATAGNYCDVSEKEPLSMTADLPSSGSEGEIGCMDMGTADVTSDNHDSPILQLGPNANSLDFVEDWNTDYTQTDQGTAENLADDNYEPESEDDDLVDEREKAQVKAGTNDNRMLYHGARVSLVTGILLMMTFISRHDLSAKAQEDLVWFLNLLLPADSIFPESLQKVKNFLKSLTVGDSETSVDPVYFCEHCGNYNGLDSNGCTNCGKKMESKDHFITLSLAHQLKTIIPECLQDITDFKRKQQAKTSTDIEDVQDGYVYKQCFDGSHFVGTSDAQKTGEVHVSLQFNTDGVQIFKSSQYSVWPLYFVINELPPLLRFTRKYRLFGGIWYGTSKPNMDVLLRWIKHQVTCLFSEGVMICCNGRDILLRGILHSGVYDLPAKASVLNFKQFNGFFGCCDCLAEGKTTPNLKGTRSHTYPFNMDMPQFGHYTLRSHEGSMKNATKAENQGFAELGVKGLTWLGCTPKYDLICSTTVDYMHCVCLGVVKTLINLWVSKEYKKNNWYIGDKVNEIDKRLQKIKPPVNITRLPHSFKDLAHWKASEFRTFLLFYSIPCLMGILPQEHFHHLLCLVQGIAILLSSKISLDNLESARLALLRFAASFDILYHPCFESCNVHSLLHLADKVSNLGPLWAHSCFFFEDLNKDLRTLFHGTQNMHNQILTAVKFQQNLPLLTKCLPPGDVTSFYNKLTSYHRIKAPQEFIHSGLSTVGQFKLFDIKPPLKEMLTAEYGKIILAYSFQRLLHNGRVIQSENYKRTTRRSSFTVAYKDESGHITSHADIKFYLKCITKSSTVYVAVVKKLVPSLAIAVNTDHIIPVVKPTGADCNLSVIDVGNIQSLCFKLSGSDDLGVDFVAHFPNFYERE